METGIELEVHNEGNPSQKDVPRRFSNFAGSKSAQEGANLGWGLGLTLVKGAADATKARFANESSAGKGTSFVLEIPFAVEAATAETRPELHS